MVGFTSVSCAFLALLAQINLVVSIEVCPGEGARYGDHKCNHDPTHRVCARLLDNYGQPLSWGQGNFWQITGQEAFQWDDQIRANHGDSWCICMWATATLIDRVGCDNVHLSCDASDIAYVEQQYTDGGVDLQPAKECLQKKCGAGAKQLNGVQQLNDAALPKSTGAAEADSGNPLPALIFLAAVIGAMLAVVARSPSFRDVGANE
eukprot:TRINITY_DN26204_c0_g1_i1.p1 TRINITY_DN26204_c0_g1~~TRINITY_DN26204_c0_g1_i1.p1  ORF type:complete len:231 (-),score=36.78 TRINITY_DN26204_c0_g1_i1:229-846(-)